MKRAFCFLLIGFVCFVVAACGGKSEATEEDYGPPIPREPYTEFFKTIVGKWRYDTAFMKKEGDKYRDGLIALAEEKQSGVSTPQGVARLDSIVKSTIAEMGWEGYRMEFFPKGKFTIKHGKNVLNGTFGIATESTDLHFNKKMLYKKKMEDFTVHKLDSVTLYQNVILSIQTFKLDGADRPLYITHKFIREP